MELVTGYHGVNHVTAEQLADLQAGILGGDYVLNIGEKLRCDIVTSNKIRIFDGVIVFGGKQAIIEAGDYEDITIENGTLGLYRNDIVVVKYVKDEETGIEGTTLEVLKGATASEAVDPLYTTNDIRSGAFESEIPLYRVKLNGLAIEAVEPMFEVANNIRGLVEGLVAVNSRLNGILNFETYYDSNISVEVTNQWTEILSHAPKDGNGIYFVIVQLLVPKLTADTMVTIGANSMIAQSNTATILANNQPRRIQGIGYLQISPSYPEIKINAWASPTQFTCTEARIICLKVK
jgi:hypothetical protein